MAQTVLVVEDEKDLQQLVSYNLRQAGYQVQVASDGQEALAHVQRQMPDLVLLDVMLPDISGFEVCKALKINSVTRGVRIIMLTARGEEVDRVVGFELGADDYVVKPFSVRELVLRVAALLRRSTAPLVADTSTITFGCLYLDREAHRVSVDGKPVELTALEFKLLSTLLERRDRVQTRDQLLDDVWGIEAAITTRTVDTHVKRLREKLGRAGNYVETVRGVGYRFAASPEES